MHSLEGIQARSANAEIDETLVGFAKAGNEADFRWLARSQGLSAEQIDELWRGTRERLGQDRGAAPDEEYQPGWIVRTLNAPFWHEIVSYPWLEDGEAWVLIRPVVRSAAPVKRVRCREVWVPYEELEASEAALRRIREMAQEDPEDKPFACDCDDPACPVAHGDKACASPCGPGLYDDVPLCNGCAEHWSPD